MTYILMGNFKSFDERSFLLKIQWRYSLINNAYLLVTIAIGSLIYPFSDKGLWFLLTILILFIISWLTYSLIFQRSYLRQHPEDKASHHELRGLGMIMTVIVTLLALLLMLTTNASTLTFCWIIFTLPFIRDCLSVLKTD